MRPRRRSMRNLSNWRPDPEPNLDPNTDPNPDLNLNPNPDPNPDLNPDPNPNPNPYLTPISHKSEAQLSEERVRHQKTMRRQYKRFTEQHARVRKEVEDGPNPNPSANPNPDWRSRTSTV